MIDIKKRYKTVSGHEVRLCFEEDWYLGAIAEHLRVVKDGEITRLIINQPPRTSESSMLATSVGGTLTGEGGSIIVIDDPHNAVEAESETVRTSTLECFDNSLSTHLNNPRTGVSILAMQRLHEGGLTGHILSSDAHDDWVRESERLRAEVERLRAALRQIAGIDPWDNSEQGFVDKARAALEEK
jgi:hypothetical protein